MLQRVVTAILLAIPALLALTLRSPWPLTLLGLVAVGIGGSEADRLLKNRLPVCTAVAVLVYAPLACTFPIYDTPPAALAFAACILCAATCFGVGAAGVPDRSALAGLARPFAGLWVAAPLLAVLLLHQHGTATNTGTWMLSPALMAMVPVWAGDIAAIFVGKAFGKHPLAPKISPKKTVEGSIGNLLAAVLTAFLLGRLLGLSDARSLGAGLAVGTLGQAGDLFESWLKRRVDVKDSGTLLPGHGGVLDRIDSVLFTAPAVALILLS
jgi:phosphatidate cytidylyltransferase